jgi:thioredoxin reductase (NADPH)
MLRACLIEATVNPGGQCRYLYPDKRMYGVPGFADIRARDYIEILAAQCLPHAACVLFEHKVLNISKDSDGLFEIATDQSTITAKYIILATGIGNVVPNIPASIQGLDKLDNSSDFVQFYCINMNLFDGKDVIIAGGGDSAVDFAIELVRISRRVTLIHRRAEFTCEPSKVAILRHLAESNKLTLKTNANITGLEESEGCRTVLVNENSSDIIETLRTDHVIFCYGFSTQQSIIPGLTAMGLYESNGAIGINIETMETSISNCYAAGDVVTYLSKKKNIVPCFFEADRAVRSIKSKMDLV